MGARAVWDSHGRRHPLPASTGAHLKAPTSPQIADNPAGPPASAWPPPAAFGTAAPACGAASTPTTSEYAKKRRLTRGHRDIGRVENRNVIKCDEESGHCITHVITHTMRTNSETISGKRDVADQPVPVTAGNDHVGGKLREVGETHGLRGNSEGGLRCGLSRSDDLSLVIANAFYGCPSSDGQSTNTYVHHWTCGKGNCGPTQSAVGHVEL